MSIEYESIKKKYFELFDGKLEYFDFIITDVLFAYKEISEIIKKQEIKRVLEVGCGTGILIRELKENFKDVDFTGLDPNQSGFHHYEKISEKILKLDKSININKCSIENFNFKGKYDLIFSFNVFEHVDNQDEYILRTMSLLENKGLNIIFAPNYDFPYEPHFLIPILLNKKLTKKIFRKRIENYESKNNEKGLWDALKFTGKSSIKKFLNKKNIDFEFDQEIYDRMIKRAEEDKFFYKRQGLAAKLAIFGKKIYLDKLIFNFLKIPHPYFKLTITK